MGEPMEDSNVKSGDENPRIANVRMADTMEDRSAKSGDDNSPVVYVKMAEPMEDPSAKSGDNIPSLSQHQGSPVSQDAPHSLSSPIQENEAVWSGPSAGEVELSLNPSAQFRSETVDLKGKRPARRRTRLGTTREEPEVERETHQQNAEHIITVRNADQRMCRSCCFDEEEENAETDNRLIKLGCGCRGSMSRMHRKCILQWFGPRIIWDNDFHCEICKGIINPRIAFILNNVLKGRDSGLDILQTALTQTRPSELLVRALRQIFPQDTSSDTETPRNERQIVIQRSPPRYETNSAVLPKRLCLGCAITWERFIGLVFFMMVVVVVLSLYIHRIPPPKSYNS